MKDERNEFEIKIDGENYKIQEKRLVASEVLALAEKSYDNFHLVELKGGSDKPVEFTDASDVVNLHHGMEFITKHIGPSTVS
ncbi:MAG: hypothetical protein CVT66_10595 [Actinobacteria bacterium HGW-Actinobacteria-6]|jgi:hypothetical protein|nr:MAG: hypothetical protein CVT66_10595 [Actinobacteria bacterium HGW-Actinobacteria-6]